MPTIACVGAIVHDAQGRLLVIQRGQPPAEGLWSIPGGRVESGETSVEACAREVAEETGLAVVVGDFVGRVEREAPDGGMYVIDDFRAAPVIPETEPRAGDDARDARWVTLAELMALPCSPGLIDTLASWNCLPTT